MQRPRPGKMGKLGLKIHFLVTDSWYSYSVFVIMRKVINLLKPSRNKTH